MITFVTSLRRALLWAVAIEAPLALLIALTGIPAPDNSALAPAVLLTVHVPGIFLLQTLGLCCGFGGSLVISDVWTGPLQHPSFVGLLALAVANLLMLALVILLILTFFTGLKRPPRNEAAA